MCVEQLGLSEEECARIALMVEQITTPRTLAPRDHPTCLLQGDLWLHSLMPHATDHRRLFVIDWEFATMGHPAEDIAHICVQAHMAMLAASHTSCSHIPFIRSFLAAYCAASPDSRGRDMRETALMHFGLELLHELSSRSCCSVDAPACSHRTDVIALARRALFAPNEPVGHPIDLLT